MENFTKTNTYNRWFPHIFIGMHKMLTISGALIKGPEARGSIYFNALNVVSIHEVTRLFILGQKKHVYLYIYNYKWVTFTQCINRINRCNKQKH